MVADVDVDAEAEAEADADADADAGGESHEQPDLEAKDTTWTVTTADSEVHP